MFYKENLVKSFESQYDLGYFSPAFTFYNGSGSFHEFEIARITSTSEIYFIEKRSPSSQLPKNGNFAVTQLTQKIALRYEFAYKLKLGSENSRIGALIGISGTPYYHKDKITPKASDLFAESQSQLGLVFSAVPRITYNLTDNWFFDFYIPRFCCRCSPYYI